MVAGYEQLLIVVGAGSAIANAIFWGAYLLGKLVGRVERLETRSEDHDQAIRELKGMGV